MKQSSKDYFQQTYPELFNESFPARKLEVGNGWHTIIDALCSFIVGPYRRAKAIDGYLRDNKERTVTFDEEVAKATRRVEEEKALLPTILQVKEKFGGLRFYVRGGSARIDAGIGIICGLSERICENCGAPGTQRNTGWVKTLCDNCPRVNWEADDDA